jgi:sporulation protein YlmC with PRC-barrel domain/ribosomal protein S27AE
MAAVPRGKLVGMQVYNPDGFLVGTVQDVELPLGGGEISLQVLTRLNTVERVPWTNIAAVGDIAILKEKIEVKTPEPAAGQPPTAPIATPPVGYPPAQPPPQPGVFTSVSSKLPFGKKKQACPTCGKELTWIEQYQRWYCYNEGKYV